jgi:hypothetical protein
MWNNQRFLEKPSTQEACLLNKLPKQGLDSGEHSRLRVLNMNNMRVLEGRRVEK